MDQDLVVQVRQLQRLALARACGSDRAGGGGERWAVATAVGSRS